MVAHGERGAAISLWVELSLSRIGKRTDRACIWWSWHALDQNQYAYPNIAVSETHFLGVLVQRWSFSKGSHLRYGERWLQGITWHNSALCPLSLLRDKLSEYIGCLSISILLYHCHIELIRDVLMVLCLTCHQNLSLSLGSSHCIPCQMQWPKMIACDSLSCLPSWHGTYHGTISVQLNSCHWNVECYHILHKYCGCKELFSW